MTWMMGRFWLLVMLLLASQFTCVSWVSIAQANEPIKVQMATDPALSPDGKTLVFSWSGDLWSVPIAGGQAEQLTTDDGRDSQPRFSPDGTRLAFISDRTGTDQIFVMPAGGGIPEQKSFHSEGYALADWFPDGESVLALGQRDHFWRGAQRMLRVPIHQRGAEKLLLDDAAAYASLSHDGSQVLFVREGERWWRKGYRGERAGQVWLLELASGECRELLHEGVECLWPMWQPDASGFYFTKGDKQGFDLWHYRFAKKENRPAKQKRLAGFDDDSIVKPTLARDGSMIVFRHLFDLYAYAPLGDEAPRKLNITIGTDMPIREDRVTTSLSRADDVAFTEDGLEIAFTAGGDLWVMDSELREPVQVTKSDGHEADPIFSTDAKLLYFTRAIYGQVDLWQAEPKTPEKFWWQQKEFVETQLTQTAESESNFELSPDGKKLYYQRGRGDLSVLDLTTRQSKVLVNSFSSIDYSISPDGQWIAYAAQDNDFNSEIWLMRVDGSQPATNVSRHPDNDQNPVFSPDGKILAFTGRRSADESDVYYVYLQAEDDEKNSRDRKLEKALEAMKKRKANDPKSVDTKPSDAKPSDAKSSEGKGESKSAASAAEDDRRLAKVSVKIDLEKIHERVRRINIPDTSERNLIFSPDSKRLAFGASVAGKSGWYSVEFPDKFEPKLMNANVFSQARWSKSAGGILGLSRGTPAKLDSNDRQADYNFSVQHERSRSGRLREGFNAAWRLMSEIWYDPAMGGHNWNGIRRKYVDAAAQMVDERGLAEIVELMLGELNGSHLGFTPGSSEPDPDPGADPRSVSDSSSRSSKTTAHLGVRFDATYQGPGLRVRDVLPGGPADLQRSQLLAGDVIKSIDGKTVDPSLDLTEVLNGPLDRDVNLVVARTTGETTADIQIVIRPISYRRARMLLYDHWLNHSRESTEKFSEGKFGYLHIRAMDSISFLEFERQLYNVGYGREGLIIDVRDNGGGSTTDHLLTALTQPRHALTIPRGGTVGYPHDRMIYATWSKPIVVLCNQNSYSNAEIFTHAIKALGRGKVVGVQTAGGVVSTGVARVNDVGVLRAPFRGWFSITTGRDFELNGAEPDVVLWPKPTEMPAGTDRQLEAAVKLLAEEVTKVKPLPKPKYATEE